MESLVEASEIKQLKERVAKLEKKISSLECLISLLEAKFIELETGQDIYEDMPPPPL